MARLYDICEQHPDHIKDKGESMKKCIECEKRKRKEILINKREIKAAKESQKKHESYMIAYNNILNLIGEYLTEIEKKGIKNLDDVKYFHDKYEHILSLAWKNNVFNESTLIYMSKNELRRLMMARVVIAASASNITSYR